MALSNLKMALTLAGAGSISGPAGLITSGGGLLLGTGPWAQMVTNLTFGTGANQANQCYYAQRTVATVTADNLDLSGSLLDPLGNTINLTTVKLIVVAIDTPDGTKKLRVGPQAVANAWQGPFGGVTAPCYKEITNWDPICNEPVAGYPVVGGASDILGIYNPSAVSVTYRILIMGK